MRAESADEEMGAVAPEQLYPFRAVRALRLYTTRWHGHGRVGRESEMQADAEWVQLPAG
jgi:hypothetical protein